MIRINNKRFEYLFLVFYLAISPISKVLERIGIPRQATYLLMILLATLYLINHYHLRRIKLDVLIAFLILFPITLFGVLLHHNDFSGANEMYAMIIVFFPAYFIMRVADIDDLIRALRTSAYIGIAVYLPNAFLIANIRDQYMTYAYDILFPLSIILFYAKTEKRWYDILISITGVILLAIFGSRGALIALILFYLYINAESIKLSRFLVISLLAVIAFLAYSNLSTILTWLSRYGISSYALTRIARGQVFTSVSRMELYNYIITRLLPHNYWGYGPVGNRKLMPVIMNHDMHYPHQLFLEILIDYGLVIGTVFSVAIIAVALYMIIKSKDKYRYLTGLFCVVSLFPLMVSGTFYAKGTIPYIFAIYMKYCQKDYMENQPKIYG